MRMVSRVTLVTLSLALSAVSWGALAQARPSTLTMTCASAAALVQREGSVVMTTGPMSYEMLVRDGGFCPLDDTTAPAYEPTTDQRLCFVGYRCKPVNRGENRPD